MLGHRTIILLPVLCKCRTVLYRAKMTKFNNQTLFIFLFFYIFFSFFFISLFLFLLFFFSFPNTSTTCPCIALHLHCPVLPSLPPAPTITFHYYCPSLPSLPPPLALPSFFLFVWMFEHLGLQLRRPQPCLL